jgi:hypothetical protein
MTAKKFEILVLNQISQIGLKRFPAEAYRIVKDAAHPDAILVRSHEIQAVEKVRTMPISCHPERQRRICCSSESTACKADSSSRSLPSSEAKGSSE